ncbi:hypothetical protein ABID37_002735 [Aquamicrobium terrae]|uniref:Transposase IS66 C-terminal domain-containing protein n=1 Tax=Aquamicrobium terrae TaxID=1324945 RepID=A0ABV2N3T7_9HYPH
MCSRRAALQALDIRPYQMKATGSGYSFAHGILLKEIIQENLILQTQPRYVGTPTRLPTIATARLNDVDPQAWLADVLARIANTPQSRLADLLPWNWRRPTVTVKAA